MKTTTIFAALAMAMSIRAAAVPNHDPVALVEPTTDVLASRDDCGAGSALYTRRTNSPCGAGNNRDYCGCDQTGVVSICPAFHSSSVYVW
jgi:hypothetical protein